jgi:hypothetical protein
MWFYSLWITILTISCIFAAILTKRVNDQEMFMHLSPKVLFWLLYALPFLTNIWPWIAKNSKTILFDGLLYDQIVFVVYYGVMLYLGSGHNFSARQWVACAVIFVAMIVLKMDLQ